MDTLLLLDILKENVFSKSDEERDVEQNSIELEVTSKSTLPISIPIFDVYIQKLN
jgi:hypothetical protein